MRGLERATACPWSSIVRWIVMSSLLGSVLVGPFTPVASTPLLHAALSVSNDETDVPLDTNSDPEPTDLITPESPTPSPDIVAPEPSAAEASPARPERSPHRPRDVTPPPSDPTAEEPPTEPAPRPDRTRDQSRTRTTPAPDDATCDPATTEDDSGAVDNDAEPCLSATAGTLTPVLSPSLVDENGNVYSERRTGLPFVSFGIYLPAGPRYDLRLSVDGGAGPATGTYHVRVGTYPAFNPCASGTTLPAVTLSGGVGTGPTIFPTGTPDVLQVALNISYIPDDASPYTGGSVCMMVRKQVVTRIENLAATPTIPIVGSPATITGTYATDGLSFGGNGASGSITIEHCRPIRGATCPPPGAWPVHVNVINMNLGLGVRTFDFTALEFTPQETGEHCIRAWYRNGALGSAMDAISIFCFDVTEPIAPVITSDVIDPDGNTVGDPLPAGPGEAFSLLVPAEPEYRLQVTIGGDNGPADGTYTATFDAGCVAGGTSSDPFLLTNGEGVGPVILAASPDGIQRVVRVTFTPPAASPYLPSTQCFSVRSQAQTQLHDLVVTPPEPLVGDLVTVSATLSANGRVGGNGPSGLVTNDRCDLALTETCSETGPWPETDLGSQTVSTGTVLALAFDTLVFTPNVEGEQCVHVRYSDPEGLFASTSGAICFPVAPQPITTGTVTLLVSGPELGAALFSADAIIPIADACFHISDPDETTPLTPTDCTDDAGEVTFEDVSEGTVALIFVSVPPGYRVRPPLLLVVTAGQTLTLEVEIGLAEKVIPRPSPPGTPSPAPSDSPSPTPSPTPPVSPSPSAVVSPIGSASPSVSPSATPTSRPVPSAPPSSRPSPLPSAEPTPSQPPPSPSASVRPSPSASPRVSVSPSPVPTAPPSSVPRASAFPANQAPPAVAQLPDTGMIGASGVARSTVPMGMILALVMMSLVILAPLVRPRFGARK